MKNKKKKRKQRKRTTEEVRLKIVQLMDRELSQLNYAGKFRAMVLIHEHMLDYMKKEADLYKIVKAQTGLIQKQILLSEHKN